LSAPVALKVLPADFATDKQRMQRFIREPKTVSALNHPNILTIYEIGHTNDTHFIATEFIEGATLRRHMKGERIRLAEVIGVAIQTADALSAAHEAGIIHGVISLTADSGTLVINQTSKRSYSSVSPANDLRQAATIHSSSSDGANGIFWTPDGKIVYTSASNGMPILVMMDADGRNQKQLTELPDWNTNASAICLTADGKYVVFQTDPEVKGQTRTGSGALT
jgi:serine/threonine protein kinase